MSRAPITITGNLTRDPELRFTPGGSAVANMGVAVNHSYKKDDEWVEEVSFFDVVAWRDLAENLADVLEKGMKVTVVGRLTQRSWETEDKEKRYKVELVADDVAVSVTAVEAVTRRERTERGESRSSGGRAERSERSERSSSSSRSNGNSDRGREPARAGASSSSRGSSRPAPRDVPDEPAW